MYTSRALHTTVCQKKEFVSLDGNIKPVTEAEFYTRKNHFVESHVYMICKEDSNDAQLGGQ
jgi:hypothetical protein